MLKRSHNFVNAVTRKATSAVFKKPNNIALKKQMINVSVNVKKMQTLSYLPWGYFPITSQNKWRISSLSPHFDHNSREAHHHHVHDHDLGQDIPNYHEQRDVNQWLAKRNGHNGCHHRIERSPRMLIAIDSNVYTIQWEFLQMRSIFLI